jgi:hypothetical protein
MTEQQDNHRYLDDPKNKCGLQKICNKGYPGKNSLGEIVCFTPKCLYDTRNSRSHNPSPETRREFLTKQNIEQFKEQEREKLLDEIQHWFKEHDCWKSEDGNYWTPVPFPASGMMQFVESLRNNE